MIQTTRNLWRTLLVTLAVLTAALTLPMTAAAAAEEDGGDGATEEQLANLEKASDEDREKVRTAAVDEATKAICDGGDFRDHVFVPVGTGGGDAEAAGDKICKEEIGGQIDKFYDTPEKAVTSEGPTRTDVCGPGPRYSALPNPGLKTYCAKGSVESMLTKARGQLLVDVVSAPGVAPVLKGASAAAEVAEFVANPEDAYAELVNYLHKESVQWTERVLDSVATSTQFDPSESWFVDSWMGAAGLGLLMLTVMLLLTLRDLGAGRIDLEDTRDSLFKWGPIAVVMAVFGPAVMTKLTQAAGAMSSGIINSGDNSVAEQVGEFVRGIAALSVQDSNLGIILGILLFLVLLVSSLMLFITFVFQEFALMFIAYGMALCIGMLINPRWRTYVLKMASTWVAILASKPVLLLLLVLVFTMPTSLGSATGLEVISQLVMVSIAMLVVALCPWLLLRYMPMVQSPSGELWANGMPSVPTGGLEGTSGGGTGEVSPSQQTVEKANQRSKEDSTAGGEVPTASGVSGRGSVGTAGPGDAGAPSGGSGGQTTAHPAPSEVTGAGASTQRPETAANDREPKGNRAADTSNDSSGGTPLATPGGGSTEKARKATPATGGTSPAGGGAGSAAGAGAVSGGTATVALLAAQASKRGMDSAHRIAGQAGDHATEFRLDDGADDMRLADGFGPDDRRDA